MSITEKPSRLDHESAAAFTRRTGQYPPEWSSERCRVQDAKIAECQDVATRGLTAQDRAVGRDNLRRWGALDE